MRELLAAVSAAVSGKKDVTAIQEARVAHYEDRDLRGVATAAAEGLAKTVVAAGGAGAIVAEKAVEAVATTGTVITVGVQVTANFFRLAAGDADRSKPLASYDSRTYGTCSR